MSSSSFTSTLSSVLYAILLLPALLCAAATSLELPLRRRQVFSPHTLHLRRVDRPHPHADGIGACDGGRHAGVEARGGEIREHMEVG